MKNRKREIRVEAEGLALSLRPLSRLAQVEEPSLRGGEAGARNGSDLREAKMSEVGNLETLRGHFVSVRRQEVAKVLRSKSRSLVAARRLKATQDIIDALDRAIVDENRLHPPPVEQPE
jgi:hypothetical protein